MRVTPKFKFGVLLCRKGQVLEEDMFSNVEGSQDYNNFLKLLGPTIELQGFNKFLGGLDAKGNTTGTHSVFAEWRGHEIMFHVSTMLPQTDNNTQQLNKKRHIGNDIVLLVFQEEGCDYFLPTCVKSNYIQVTIVVRVLKEPNAP
eukprot:TRINITY_DN961_c0_g2_i9.p1 TRINITY_DN961_c0_g2~~TRINITY_DN961_c0_g2_i9.p1  ORF type:complete len:145 (+),score=19.96 TRINITY_DN961_c0_g2_i9:186-620(+)